MDKKASESVIRFPVVVPAPVGESIERLLCFGYDQFNSGYEDIPEELFEAMVEIDEWLGTVRTMQIRIHRVKSMAVGLILLSLFFLPELVQFFAGARR